MRHYFLTDATGSKVVASSAHKDRPRLTFALIVEFANQRQLAGLDRRAAVIEAAALRLRPILMTTGAMVLGAVPLALAVGAGAENREQIGLVIVGGMSLGTLLTLFVVPAVYSYLGQKLAPRNATEPALKTHAAE